MILVKDKAGNYFDACIHVLFFYLFSKLTKSPQELNAFGKQT